MSQETTLYRMIMNRLEFPRERMEKEIENMKNSPDQSKYEPYATYRKQNLDAIERNKRVDKILEIKRWLERDLSKADRTQAEAELKKLENFHKPVRLP